MYDWKIEIHQTTLYLIDLNSNTWMKYFICCLTSPDISRHSSSRPFPGPGLQLFAPAASQRGAVFGSDCQTPSIWPILRLWKFSQNQFRSWFSKFEDVWTCLKRMPKQVEKILAEIRQERCKASPGAECLESDLLELLLIVFQEFPQWLKILSVLNIMTLTWLYYSSEVRNSKPEKYAYALPAVPPDSLSAASAAGAKESTTRAAKESTAKPGGFPAAAKKGGLQPGWSDDLSISRSLDDPWFSCRVGWCHMSIHVDTCRYMSDFFAYLINPNQPMQTLQWSKRKFDARLLQCGSSSSKMYQRPNTRSGHSSSRWLALAALPLRGTELR